MGSTSDLFAFKDREFRYRIVNQSTCRFVNRPNDEVIGATDFDLFPEEDAQRLRADDIWVVENNESIRRDEWVGGADAGTWLSTTKSSVVDSEGNTLGILFLARDITARKTAESRLKDALRRSEIAERAGNIGTWQMEIESGRSWWSDQFFRICGYRPGEVEPSAEVGFATIHPEDRERASQALTEAIAQKSTYDIEKRIVRPDGVVRWVHSAGTVLLDKDGNPSTLVGAFLDITTRKEAEIELQATLADLELAQAIADVGNWQFDPAVGIPVWSDEVYLIYERDPKSGPPSLSEYHHIYDEEQFQIFYSAFQRALQEGIPYDITLKLRLSAERIKWVHAIGRPYGSPGPKGFRIRGTIQDVTHWKEVEALLSRQKEQFEAVVENIPAGLAVFDENQRVTYVSPVYKELYGYSEEEEKGRGIHEISGLVHPEDRDDLATTIYSAIREGRDSCSYEYRFRHKDGRYVWRRDRTRFLYDQEGGLYRSYVISSDITAEKAAERRSEMRSRRELVLGNCRSILLQDFSEYELCERFVEELSRNLGYVCVWIGFKENDSAQSVRVAAFRGLEKRHMDSLRLSWGDDERGNGPVGRSIRTGATVVMNREDSSFAVWQERGEAEGIGAVCSVPMKTAFDVVGVIVFDTAGFSFEEDEISFMERVAFDLAAGIEDRRNRTELERQTRIIQRERDYFQTVTELTGDIIVQLDPSGLITFVNRGACEFWGRSERDLIGTHFESLVADEELPRTRASAQRVFANEEPVRGFVNSQNTPRGRREVLWNAQALTDPDGTVIGIQATGRDITAMKERERQLEKLNQEKELLVNEVNHRVKNNLAVVASLVRLKDDDLGADTDLSDVAHQVEAIRIVHEKLYKGGDVTHIEMRSYIEELLGTVFSSPAGRAVEINTEIGEIKLPSKIAVSLGLIINELATNALKYGSSRSENARFELSFTQVTRREEYTLVIANSGDPIPETVSLDNPSTLGLRLISSLVRQIDGTISMERTPRPTFTICFAINEDR